MLFIRDTTCQWIRAVSHAILTQHIEEWELTRLVKREVSCAEIMQMPWKSWELSSAELAHRLCWEQQLRKGSQASKAAWYLTSPMQGKVLIHIMCARVSVCLCVRVSATTLAGATSTIKAKVKYHQTTRRREQNEWTNWTKNPWFKSYDSY